MFDKKFNSLYKNHDIKDWRPYLDTLNTVQGMCWGLGFQLIQRLQKMQSEKAS